MTTTNKIKVCPDCRGLSDPETLCQTCIGSGWIWSDGVPATVCPGGAASTPGSVEMGRDVKDLPCGRTGERCPGCGRFSADIGTPEDRARTVEWQAGKVRRHTPRLLPNDIDHLDPGIEDLVRKLRDAGVSTTDSGDGVSKLPGGHWERLGFQAYDPADVIPYPHVVIVEHARETVGDALAVFAEHAGEGWTFDVSVLSSVKHCPLCIVAYKKPKEDEADRAHAREQLTTQLAEMERACVEGQAEIEALRARVGSLEALFKSANDDSALAWSTVGRICKALWVDVLERPEAEGVNRDHEEIVEEVIAQRDLLRSQTKETVWPDD